ncbi:hypothetical protein BUALT_Bualt06G0071800 [Buddleja alternifolia]|uniref:RING-type E3 ubiquitin transferase n=1 Tax=Buddleja alternifolia TaxID=168488 RepID=A0AAV6XPJ6_9LAMI|nr:hypothetical protein BUALT_Bualt06G0071800 [Buddleja alternifolia]
MDFYHWPRRLLLDAVSDGAPPHRTSFDAHMVIILAALLCALICALGVNSIIRCALRCARRVSFGAAPGDALRHLKGLQKAAIRRIPVAVYGSGEEVGFTDCAICLDEFLDGEKIRVLPKCSHCYHVNCVDTWLASNSSCPTCRQSLMAEQADSGGEVVVEVAGREMGSL